MPARTPTVISFFTRGTRYEALAQRLIASCQRFDLPHCIIPHPTVPVASDRAAEPGSAEASDADPARVWTATVARKPAFMRDMLVKHRGPVLWLDADCTIVRDPVLLRGCREELAVYNFFADPLNETGEYDPRRLWAASGVVYLDFTPAAMNFVNAWADQLDRAPWMIDDQAMSWVFNNPAAAARAGAVQRVPRPTTLWLPRAYNRMSGKWPDVEPVIDHEWSERTAR
jgi:hypothetical protein